MVLQHLAFLKNHQILPNGSLNSINSYEFERNNNFNSGRGEGKNNFFRLKNSETKIYSLNSLVVINIKVIKFIAFFCKELEKFQEENADQDCFKLSNHFKSIEKPLHYAVKKKIQVQEEVYLFEMRTVPNEDHKIVYQFEGYNLESAEAMKTLILTPSQLEKALDSFDYQEVLPFHQKNKDVNNFLDFVKFWPIKSDIKKHS